MAAKPQKFLKQRSGQLSRNSY